jgi:phosphoribosyl 1,2-cyclic phosphodiesterase
LVTWSPAADVRVVICGVRGSTPSPGTEYAGIGGNTSCVALARAGAAPTLVLDAGTGLRRLTTVLEGEPFRGTILLGHLHWDHTQGLPFFAAGDRDDAVVRVAMPRQGEGVGAIGLLARAMSPPHFPIGPGELRGSWSFEMIDEGAHRFEGFDVLAREIPHKGGRTFGYRVGEPGGPSIAYLSDHAPQELGDGEHGLGALHPVAMELAAGVDLLIHDAQYTPDEMVTRRRFGHSAADYAAVLGAAAGARRVLLFHHDPNRADDEVGALAEAVSARNPQVPLEAAAEGMVIEL